MKRKAHVLLAPTRGKRKDGEEEEEEEIVAVTPIDADPGDKRDPPDDAACAAPAKKKRRFGEELHDKVVSIESELEGLTQLANRHNIGSYLSDLTSQLTNLSQEVKKRLDELSHLDSFLVCISLLTLIFPETLLHNICLSAQHYLSAHIIFLHFILCFKNIYLSAVLE